jgi:AcrR family transcriptional regulator
MKAEREPTRARLLSEARDLYLEGGLGDFSLREVARRAGVSAAAVYRHYDGKEALLREACGEGFRIFSSYLLQALAGATPRERMALSALQYLRFGLEHPLDYRFIFMGAAEHYEPLAPPQTGQQEPTFQFLVDRVKECIDAGVLRDEDARETALVIWSFVHGLVSLRLSGHLGRLGNDAKFTRFYKRETERFLAGLGR